MTFLNARERFNAVRLRNRVTREPKQARIPTYPFVGNSNTQGGDGACGEEHQIRPSSTFSFMCLKPTFLTSVLLFP